MSVEDYLRLDRASDVRLEFHDGEVFPIDDISFAHGAITMNLGVCLAPRLKSRPCRTLAGVRVRTTPSNFVRPDVAVVCGEPQFADTAQEMLTNPKVVIEILSRTTADYDRGSKFVLYRKLESIQEYVVVSQDAAMIDVFTRQADATWTIRSFEGIESQLRLASLDLTIPLSEIYDGIALTE